MALKRRSRVAALFVAVLALTMAAMMPALVVSAYEDGDTSNIVDDTPYTIGDAPPPAGDLDAPPPPVDDMAPPLPPADFIHQPVIGTRDLVLFIDSTEYIIGGLAGVLEVAPTIIDDRTMVPFRFIGNYLGATVNWNPETYTAYFTLGDIFLSLQIGEPLYNDAGDYMGTPVIRDERTLVPMRVVSESMGARVSWNQDARTVTVTVPM